MGTRGFAKRPDHLKACDHSLLGAVLYGLDGFIVDVQARAIEAFDEPIPWRRAARITGMARGAVSEALDRITGAFAKYQVPDPQVEILINLAPADLSKEGTWLDLPLAIIMLQAAGLLPDMKREQEQTIVLTGELGLHGELRRVPGVLSLAFAAKAGQTLVVPAGNEKECALVTAMGTHKGCKVGYASDLMQVVRFFKGTGKLSNALGQKIDFQSVVDRAPNFAQVRGQEAAKRGAVIAAAGGHNLLMVGPPGEGKSLLASAISGILPRLENEEKVELTRIYSAYGALEQDGQAVTRRPIRSVHHTTSKQALVGGGSGVPKPGEITLAHLGILFLDELAEFSAPTIEALRQPMENGFIDVTRVQGSLRFPSRFTLVAAMNPCPCGYFGSDQCRCKPADVKRYLGKLSGPILDRLDLQVHMKPLTTDQRFADVPTHDESGALRATVESARKRQRERFKDLGVPHNAAMPGGRVRELAAFSDEGFERFKSTADSSRLSTRSVDRLAKVSRTIADLGDSDLVGAAHVDEAAGFVVGGLLREGVK